MSSSCNPNNLSPKDSEGRGSVVSIDNYIAFDVQPGQFNNYSKERYQTKSARIDRISI